MAKMKPKTYLVNSNGEESLIRSLTRATAIHYVAARSIDCEVATAEDLIRLTKAGVEVEDAKEFAAALTLPLPLENPNEAPVATEEVIQPAPHKKPAGKPAGSKARR